MKKKVRMKVSIAAVDFSYGPGQVVEIDAEVAAKWCDSGLAEPFVEDDKPTKLTTKPKGKAGEDDGSEADNAASKRTGKRK